MPDAPAGRERAEVQGGTPCKVAHACLALIVGVLRRAAAEEVWQTLPKFPPMPKADESGMAPVNDIQMYYAIYGAEAAIRCSCSMAASAIPMSGATRSRR